MDPEFYKGDYVKIQRPFIVSDDELEVEMDSDHWDDVYVVLGRTHPKGLVDTHSWVEVKSVNESYIPPLGIWTPNLYRVTIDGDPRILDLFDDDFQDYAERVVN